MSRLERHLIPEADSGPGARRRWPVSEYAVELLLAESGALEDQIREQIREGDLNLESARELLANALGQLGDEHVSYRLHQLERAAWSIHIDPLQFGGWKHRRHPTLARREIRMEHVAGARIGPCGDGGAMVGMCGIANNGTHAMLPIVGETEVPTRADRRRLPVGTILVAGIEEKWGVVGRARIRAEPEVVAGDAGLRNAFQLGVEEEAP